MYVSAFLSFLFPIPRLSAFSVQSSISDGASASETDMEDASSNNDASMPPSTEGPFDRSDSIPFNFQISIWMNVVPAQSSESRRNDDEELAPQTKIGNSVADVQSSITCHEMG